MTMTLAEAQAILKKEAERVKRTTFAAPVTRDTGILADRHAPFGAARH